MEVFGKVWSEEKESRNDVIYIMILKKIKNLTFSFTLCSLGRILSRSLVTFMPVVYCTQHDHTQALSLRGPWPCPEPSPNVSGSRQKRLVISKRYQLWKTLSEQRPLQGSHPHTWHHPQPPLEWQQPRAGPASPAPAPSPPGKRIWASVFIFLSFSHGPGATWCLLGVRIRGIYNVLTLFYILKNFYPHHNIERSF